MTTKFTFGKLHHFIVEELPPYFRAAGKKSWSQQFFEMNRIYRRYRWVPYHYLKHSLYLKSFDGDLLSYLPAKMMERFIEESNPKSHVELALNKRLFSQEMSKVGLPVVRDLFVVVGDDKIYSGEGQLLSYVEFQGEVAQSTKNFFFKPTFGSLGKGAFNMSPGEIHKRGNDEFVRRLFQDFPEKLERSYLVQHAIEQHQTLASLASQSVNTVRIDTFWDGKRIVTNSAVLRVGNGISPTDNWAAGGLIVKIDFATGKLVGLGKRKAKFGKQNFERHPVSGVTFAELQLPYWAEVKTLAERAALELLPLRCIGWDVAITVDGPVLIEANDNYDIFLSQEAYGGYRDTPLGKATLRHAGH